MCRWPLFLVLWGCSSASTPSNVPAASQGGSGGSGTSLGPGTAGAAPTGGNAMTSGGAGGRGNEATAGGMVTMLTLKQPIDRGDGKLVLELGSTYFEVEPERGGRITSLRQAGQELLKLTGASNYEDAVGSTFWPSPQRWPWPPPAEIDNAPYVASVEPSGVINLQGSANEETSLTVSKRFSANLAREAIDVVYTMKNTGSEPVSWAPWEITRLSADGLAFWPTGGTPFGEEPLGSTTAAGHTWCRPSEAEGEGKLFADGAGGYLAYLVGDRLLIKQFPDLPASAAAPDEAEIELYVNPDHSYFELEQQGAYGSIPVGSSVSWKVTWYVRKLPAGAAWGVGSTDLVAFVAKTLE